MKKRRASKEPLCDKEYESKNKSVKVNYKFDCASNIEKLKELVYDFYGKDYLLTWDLKRDDLLAILYVAESLEWLRQNGNNCRVFDSGLAVANFRDKSTRTRFSYTSASSLLGLTPSEIDETKSQIAHGETVRETANMISFLTEAIGIRDDLFIHEGHKYQKQVADAVEQGFQEGILPQRPPVINLQCDQDHPTQSMADLMHLINHFGGLKNLKGKKLAMTWAYSPSYGKPLSVPQALITLLPRFGVNVSLAHPEGYELLPDIVSKAKKFAAENGCTFEHTNSMKDAFKGADVVYPKSWAPFNIMEERARLLKKGEAGANEMTKLEKKCLIQNAQFKDWECTEKLMELTHKTLNGIPKQEALYCHCLPADISAVSCQQGEVEASVFERYRLDTYLEAAHKPYVIAAAIVLSRFRDVPSVLQRLLARREKGKLRIERPLTQPIINEIAKFPAPNRDPVIEEKIFENIVWPSSKPVYDLDKEIAQLAEKYTPLAVEILKEAIRIPMDTHKNNNKAGMSNNEGPRLKYLLNVIRKEKAVEKDNDVEIDTFGNLLWTVYNTKDGISMNKKKVIYFDGHTDTVDPLPEEWKRKAGSGLDCFQGLIDSNKVNVDFLRQELGYLPNKSEWKHILFGRGSADQLSGVVAQIVATKIMLELKGKGALDGVIIRSYGTVAEEDNDGGGPMYIVKNIMPKHPEYVPDVVIHTEGTGDKDKGACGIYIGQRGRMQIEVELIGRSCHGSMPWEGTNPLEYGAAIIQEARIKFQQGNGFLKDDFLGGGTRVTSMCNLSTPSDCAVPASFTFRFDRRLTVGESPEQAIIDVESLRSVKVARRDGVVVNIRVPSYNEPTHKGYNPDNKQIYLGWCTPPSHQAVQTAYESYSRVVTNQLLSNSTTKHDPTKVSKEPRVSRWIFSTDGVGYPIKTSDKSIKTENRDWVVSGSYKYPAQIGMGIGYEQNTHKIGEFIDTRHFPAAIAFCSRFPSLYAKRTE